jgi:hypothetical protein
VAWRCARVFCLHCLCLTRGSATPAALDPCRFVQRGTCRFLSTCAPYTVFPQHIPDSVSHGIRRQLGEIFNFHTRPFASVRCMALHAQQGTCLLSNMHWHTEVWQGAGDDPFTAAMDEGVFIELNTRTSTGENRTVRYERTHAPSLPMHRVACAVPVAHEWCTSNWLYQLAEQCGVDPMESLDTTFFRSACSADRSLSRLSQATSLD